MRLEEYSMGLGDRFLHQGTAQLRAIVKAKEAGVDITPVWNKSDREHKDWRRRSSLHPSTGRTTRPGWVSFWIRN